MNWYIYLKVGTWIKSAELRFADYDHAVYYARGLADGINVLKGVNGECTTINVCVVDEHGVICYTAEGIGGNIEP